MLLHFNTVRRRCERSESIRNEVLAKHRSGLLHCVRNDGDLSLSEQSMILPCPYYYPEHSSPFGANIGKDIRHPELARDDVVGSE